MYSSRGHFSYSSVEYFSMIELSDRPSIRVIIIIGGKMKKRILAVRTFDTPQSSNPTTSISNQRFTRAPSNRVPFSPTSDVESRVR